MTEVILGLGSNVRRYHHLCAGLDALRAEFGDLSLSRVYESESIGFRGSLFLNMVVSLCTVMPLAELAGKLKAIEASNGRIAGAPKFSPRSLDIDVLCYDNLCGVYDGIELPRDEILFNAFVLLPLSELMPDQRHPQVKKSYRELWAGYQQDQKLWPVDFRWHHRLISSAK
jgi:2-amino-4-hydroxy-6-hydroxymethyldihydropteridine diphosphokinase